MLKRTSKRVQEVVDKIRLPDVVRLSRSFWDDVRNGTEEAMLQFVLRQLAAMTACASVMMWHIITLAAMTGVIVTLELPGCKMTP
jgi:predicted RecB family endonuclease